MINKVLRGVGILFLTIAVAILALIAYVANSDQSLSDLTGKVWFALHPGSLNLIQAITERHLSPVIWDSVINPLLLLPAWQGAGILFVVTLVIGALFFLATKPAD